MKKHFIFLLVLIITVLFTACSNNLSNPNPPKLTIDLRNKDINGNISRNAITTNKGPIGQFFKKEIDCYYGDLTDEDLLTLISFEDAEKGFKIIYKTPEKLQGKNYHFQTRIFYIDGNNNWSTCQNINFNYINENGCVIDECSWVYPWVLPGKTYTFAIQFQYANNDPEGPKGPDFQLYYKVTPNHGIGIVDDLPKDYDSIDYTSFENGIFSLINVIPPESEYELLKTGALWGIDVNTEHWGQNANRQWLKGFDDEITDDENSALVKDFNGFVTTDLPYVFCQFSYKYYLEGFDYCYFNTPGFTSKIIDNVEFKN